VADLGALARVARDAPRQLDRLLALGEEILAVGRGILELGERLDRRAEAILATGDSLDRRAGSILAVGESLDSRAAAIMELGERLEGRGSHLVELGTRMETLGGRIDVTGQLIAQRAGEVVETATELISVLPALEKAIELAVPLEGTIDRIGRFMDRLPGGAARRAGESESQTG
jgi:hypothetical protein